MKKVIRQAAAVLVSVVTMAGQASAAAPTLTPGARGTDVGIMQRLLSYGGNPVAITELIGPTTEGLIKDYQKRHGLIEDGIVGAATWRSLQPTLREGASSPAVKALQIALNEKHGYDLPVTGYFGPMTRSAVTRFQEHMGLTVDGIVGHASWDALIGHFAELPASGPGWYRCEDATDTWASANTVATLKLVAQRWNDARYGVRLGVNDMSRSHGGYFWPHAGHRTGREADFRLLRNDGLELPVSTFRNEAYSRSLTQRLVNLLWATGEVSSILFNDPKVTGVQPWPGHDDHVHVNFKR